jgi:hypothetical protein
VSSDPRCTVCGRPRSEGCKDPEYCEWQTFAAMAELMHCPECMGDGEIQYEFLDYRTQTPDTKVIKCDNCNGTGKRSEL